MKEVIGFFLMESHVFKRQICAVVLSVLGILATGTGLADEYLVTNSAPTSETLPPPTVAFVVYDGTAIPATAIAGCSEPTCLGVVDGSDPTPGTGFVTHAKNNIGWMVAGGTSRGSVYLYVDGQKATSVRPGKQLVWSAAMGTSTLQVMTYNSDGVAGWSAPLTLNRQ
jgi:hypothetical protein